MKCWSCDKDIPDGAEMCPHCHMPPTIGKEERQVVESMLAGMSPDEMNALREAFEQSEDADDFVSRVMIGDCPACGGSKTRDCENVPDIENPCIARCLDCQQLWCPDCGEQFGDNQSALKHDCPAWEDMDLDDDWDDEL